MVYFRKCFPAGAVDRFNEAIAVVQVRAKLEETGTPLSSNDDPPDDNCSGQTGEQEQPKEKTKNQGKRHVYANCTPADVAYPTDLNLLNKAREKAEKIIDTLIFLLITGVKNYNETGT